MRTHLLWALIGLIALPAAAQSWQTLTIPSAETIRSVYFPSDSLGWAAGYNGVVMRTDNGGANWTLQNSGTTQRLLAVRFVDANNGWLLGGRYLGRSSNGGSNWTTLLIDPNASIFRNTLYPVSSTVAWAPAVCGSCVQRWFYRYTLGANDTVAEQVFDLVGSSNQFLDLYFVDADNGWAVGTSGLIRRISNASSSAPVFSAQNSGTNVQLNGVFMLNATTGWIVGNSGSILTTSNGGTNWTAQVSGSTQTLRAVHFQSALQGYAAGDAGSMLRTTDGGLNWVTDTSGVSTVLWRLSGTNAVYAGGGDLTQSANAVVIKRAAPASRIFVDGFEGLDAALSFVPDPGIRMDNASNAKAGVDGSGTVFLYYEDRVLNARRLSTSADGLSFAAGQPYTTFANHPGRVRLSDGSWRRYSLSPQFQLSSERSDDGLTFVPEAGIRYSPAPADNGSMGVYDIFAVGSQVVMLYLGDLPGLNNTRRALSSDNGLSFTFERSNVLGDAGAGGGGNSFVDIESRPLADGSRRLYAMRGGLAIYSFLLNASGDTAVQESGARVQRSDWTEFSVSGLFDPSVVQLPDGRYRMYVTGQIGSRQALLSATTR